MESMEDNIPIPPAVSSLLPVPSSNQSVLFAREPPTESENELRAATSLLAPLVKKLLGFVSAVVPGVSVASCTKSRPFNGNCATCCEVMTWPSEGLVVSTATSEATTSTDVLTDAGDKAKSSSRCSSTCSFTSFISTAWNPLNSTRTVYTATGNRLTV